MRRSDASGITFAFVRNDVAGEPNLSAFHRSAVKGRGNLIMPGNTFGELFRVTTAGVSHGPGYLVIVDGCPPGLPLSEDDLLPDLRRRRPGQSTLVTQRKEEDLP